MMLAEVEAKIKEQDWMMLAKVKKQDGIMLANNYCLEDAIR